MPSNNESPRRVGFKHVEPGDPVSAGEWNKLTKEVSRGTAQPNMHPKKPTRAIKLMQMTVAMGQFGEGIPDVSGDGDSSMAQRRTADVWHYDDVLNDFVPNSDGEEKTNVSDALKLIYDSGELVWMMYLEQSGMWHPINPRTIRHAKTVKDVYNQYPDNCLDRIYPIKFIKLEYEKNIDAAAPVDGSYLDFTDTTPDDYVLNLFVESELNYPYIPEGTMIWCYNVLNQWYTYIDSFLCEGSSSSSDSSSGESLSGSSASSLSSLSSESTASSQSTASSDSDKSASSQGSSASSSSTSSGGSSYSSSNDGYTCQNFVESVSFDGETCVLTYTVKCLCWPTELGIFVRSECV